jgi:hypothetical protein
LGHALVVLGDRFALILAARQVTQVQRDHVVLAPDLLLDVVVERIKRVVVGLVDRVFLVM